MKTKSRWVSWRMASALLALPLLSMTVPVFAAAPPASVSIVAPSMASGSTPITIAVPSTAAASSLTAAQSQQAITVANAYATTASNGTITVSATVLAQQGLSSAQVQWVESSMQTFDQGVENGTVNPNLVTNTPAGVPMPTMSSTAGTWAVTPSTTGGLSYSWFVSSYPYFMTEAKWYGSLWILNSVAAIDVANACGNDSYSLGAFSVALAFIPAAQAASLFTGIVSVGIGAVGYLIAGVNVGFGVNFPLAFGAIPFSVNANDY